MPGLTTILATPLLLSGCQVATPPDTVEVGDLLFVSRQILIEGADAAAADLNADGNIDLVGSGEPLTIFLGDGNGGLSSSSQISGGEDPTDLDLSDLDGDGDIDIIVANHETDHVTILLGGGNGEFQAAPQSPFRVGVDPHPHTVEAVDLDSDGLTDLVVDDRNAHGLRVFRGLGEGRLDESSILIDAGGDPYIGMAIGDINGDGWLDVVTPNTLNLAVMLGDRGLQFGQPQTIRADSPFGVRIADFNGDAQLDLLSISGENSSTVELFLGDGQGVFSESNSWNPTGMFGAKNLVIGDFNGDRLADAAITGYQASNVVLILSGRDSVQTASMPAGVHPWGLAAADFNGDGLDDLVIANDTSREGRLYLSVVSQKPSRDRD